jgi:hypothetical protein
MQIRRDPLAHRGQCRRAVGRVVLALHAPRKVKGTPRVACGFTPNLADKCGTGYAALRPRLMRLRIREETAVPKRVMFTGGSGKAGRHVLPWLCDRGYEILNFDLQPSAHPDIFSLVGDVTDTGQVFNAMTMHFGRKGLQAGKPSSPVDASATLSSHTNTTGSGALSATRLLGSATPGVTLMRAISGRSCISAC